MELKEGEEIIGRLDAEFTNTGRVILNKMPNSLTMVCLLVSDLLAVAGGAYADAALKGLVDDTYTAPGDVNAMVFFDEKDDFELGQVLTRVSITLHDNNVVVVSGVLPDLKRAMMQIMEGVTCVLKRFVDEGRVNNLDDNYRIKDATGLITTTSRNIG